MRADLFSSSVPTKENQREWGKEKGREEEREPGQRMTGSEHT